MTKAGKDTFVTFLSPPIPSPSVLPKTDFGTNCDTLDDRNQSLFLDQNFRRNSGKLLGRTQVTRAAFNSAFPSLTKQRRIQSFHVQQEHSIQGCRFFLTKASDRGRNYWGTKMSAPLGYGTSRPLCVLSTITRFWPSQWNKAAIKACFLHPPLDPSVPFIGHSV